jgi:hypothetical protein
MVLALAVLAAGHGAAQAQATGRVGLLLAADAGVGGDTVDTLYYTNGSTQKIRAGNGVTLAAGLYYQMPNSPLDLVASVGYKFSLAPASNGNPTLTRTVFTARADYHLDDSFWVGGGPVLHTNIQYDSDGFGFNQTFDNATGFSVVAGWRYLALTFTQISYKNQYQEKLSANSVAAGVNWRF